MKRFFRFLPALGFLVASGEAAATSGKSHFGGFQAGVLVGSSITRTEFHEPDVANPLAENGILSPTGFASGLYLGYGLQAVSF